MSFETWGEELRGWEWEGSQKVAEGSCQISTFLVPYFLENLSKTSLKIYAKLLKKILLASQSAIQLDI